MRLHPKIVRIAVYWTNARTTAGSMTAWVAEGYVLLVRSRVGEELWGFPGGTLKRHEHPIDGAHRELAEETGVKLPVARFGLYGVNSQLDARHIEAMYRIRGTEGSIGHPNYPSTSSESTESTDRFEIAEVKWHPIHNLPPLRKEARFALDYYPGLLDE